MTRALLAALAAGALGVTACDPDPSDAYPVDAPPATRAPAPSIDVPAEGEPVETFPPNGEVVEVRALDNSFRAETIEIVAGTEVLWVNRGRNEHNVLPAGGVGDYGVERDAFEPGDEYAHVFDTPGVYPYYCSLHGTEDVGMIGTVVVTSPV